VCAHEVDEILTSFQELSMPRVRTRNNIAYLYKKQLVKEKPSQNIRIKDIARRAGVSSGTVDRVLHHRGEVSPETKEKVLKIIEELEYSPNLLASTLASSRTHSVAVLIPAASKENPFWAEHLRGIQRAGVELAPYGFKLDVYPFSMADTLDFRKKSDDLLESQPDSILIAPVFYRESVHFLGKCREKGIPFALIDTPIDQFEYLSFIGQNSCQSGAVGAKLLSMKAITNGQYLIFNITHEKDQLHHLSDREKGFRLFFENRGSKIRILTFDVHDGDTNTIRDTLIKYQKDPDTLSGIFVTGSKVNRVAEALEELNMPDVCLVGYDLIKDNLDYLRRDVIDFLICQQPEEQAYLGVTSIFNSLVLKKEVPAVQAMPIDIITRENLDQYPKCR